MNDNIFNEDEINNLDNENSKKIKLLYDEKPEIVSYGKAAATDIGDFICSFIEHLWTRFGKMSDQIKECSIQYTSPLIPDLTDQQTSNSLYERDIIPMNFPPSNDYKNLEGNILYLLRDRDPKFTDDTFFDKNAYKSCLEHDEEYKLSQDRNQYDFVSDNENFANKKTEENNLEHVYTFNLATSRANSPYVEGELCGAGNVINAMSKHVSDNQGKDFNFSKFVSIYKSEQKKCGGFGGRSYGNGAVMQNGVNIFAAQGFKQGLKLTDTLINNIYDHDYSRRAARSLFTAGFCANCGLRQETILNIVHFLYYDPDPLKNGEKHTNPEDNKDPETGKVGFTDGRFLEVGNYNFCTLDMISHRQRQGKTLEDTEPNELQKMDEEDCNGYVEHNYFATNALATAMLVLKICLTSQCAEEAIRKILRAAGDSDTIAAAAMPIIAALFGLPKDWIEKIWIYSMQKNKMTTEEPTQENTKQDGEPDDVKNIKKFDENRNFISYTEINRRADKTYGHHYRENVKIEWQLKNIYELMEYLIEEKENSKAKNIDELLKYIFKRIRADIDFMLDKNKKYELEKEPELDITEEEIEQAKKLTKEQTSSDEKAHALRLKYLEAKNKVRIYKHKNATAEFQTKAKNDKLNNLTQENVKNIKTELEKINDIFGKNGIDAIKANEYEALNENNCKINSTEKNNFYDDKIYDDMNNKALEKLKMNKKKYAEYIKIKTAKSGENTTTEIKNTENIFWTWKKKSLAGAVALIIVAGNVVLFWQLSFAVASLSALGTWTLYFFVLWLINHFNKAEPNGTIGNKEPKNNKNPVIGKGKTKEKIKQPLINNKSGPIIDPNQK